MIVSGTFAVEAGRDTAWRQLSALADLGPLLPGCESIASAGEAGYTVHAQVKVGPIKARLAGTLTVVEVLAPEAMRLRIEGQDALTGSHVRAAIEFRLAATGPDTTDVSYQADVLISGALGTIGQGLVRQTVATMLEEFVRRLNARIKGEPLDATGPGTLAMRAVSRSVKSGVTSLFPRTEAKP